MKPYISAQYLPPSLHLNLAALYWLYSDRYHFHVAVDAVVFTLLALVAVGGAIRTARAKAMAPALIPLDRGL